MADRLEINGIEATKCDFKVKLEEEKPKSWLKSVSALLIHGAVISISVTQTIRMKP